MEAQLSCRGMEFETCHYCKSEEQLVSQLLYKLHLKGKMDAVNAPLKIFSKNQ